MFSFPISVKDLGERPLAGLLSGALLIYAGLWFAAAVTDLAMKHRLPVGPARWALQTLSSHGAYVPSWLEEGLLEPSPSVWLLVIPAVLANYWRAPYGIRVALILLSLEWCGLRETAISYLAVAAAAGVAHGSFALYLSRLDYKRYVEDAGGPTPPLLVGFIMFAEPFFHPFLVVPLEMARRSLVEAHFDDRRRTKFEFGVCDDLRSTPLAEATALDLTNALWLARQPKYKPFAEIGDHARWEQWLDEGRRLDELAEHLALRTRGEDLRNGLRTRKVAKRP